MASLASPSAELPTVIADRYRLLRLLGEGGMGRVFEAEHVETRRRFAIKIMRSLAGADELFLRRFRREAVIGASIESRYVVAVIDVGILADETPFFVMEFANGTDLRTLLKAEGPLAPIRACRIVADACKGVAAAHRAKVVHRDLKPSNLIVGSDDDGLETCRVLDFGVARYQEAENQALESALTSTGGMVGTLAYMAPEQVRGDGEIDVRVDVYALGAILYESIAGKRPFAADRPETLMYKILQETPVRLDEACAWVPPGLARLVERALARSPDARYQTVADLLVAITPFCASLPTSGARPSPESTSLTTGGSAIASGSRTSAPTPLPTAPAFARKASRRSIVGGLGLLTLGLVIGAGAAWFVLRAPIEPKPVPFESTSSPAPATFEPAAAPTQRDEPRAVPNAAPATSHAAAGASVEPTRSKSPVGRPAPRVDPKPATALPPPSAPSAEPMGPLRNNPYL